MRIPVLDRIFWFRTGLAALAGFVADYLFGRDYESGLFFAALLFLLSYYAVRFLWGKKLKPDQSSKLLTTAIGTYVLVFLFVWILCFTLGLNSLNL